jgi:hypothetical protein
MVRLLLTASRDSQAGKHLGVLFLKTAHIDAGQQVTELVYLMRGRVSGFGGRGYKCCLHAFSFISVCCTRLVGDILTRRIFP